MLAYTTDLLDTAGYPSSSQASYIFGSENQYRIRVANDAETRRRAYNLVYKAYLEQGYANVHSSEMWLTIYDALPETVTFLIEKDDQPVGALTVVPDSPLGLAADALYRMELDGLRNQGHKIAEVISFGVQTHSRDVQVLAMLFNAVYLYAYRVADVTDFVMTCIPQHAKFYRRTLCFSNLGPPRSHSRVNGTIGCAEHLQLAALEEMTSHAYGTPSEKLLARHTMCKYFLPPAEEALFVNMVRENVRPMTPEELYYFCVDQTAIFSKAKPAHRMYLLDRYWPCDILEKLPAAATGSLDD